MKNNSKKLHKDSLKPRLKIHVAVVHDDDADSPVDTDVYGLVTFNSRSIYFSHRWESELAEHGIKIEDVGKTWWPLSCYEHGGTVYSIRGHESSVCEWDTTKNAGILFIRSGDPTEVGPDPLKQARLFIETFNDWIAGNSWGYNIVAKCSIDSNACPHCGRSDNIRHEEEISSCYGFVGNKHFINCLHDELYSLLTDANWFQKHFGTDKSNVNYKIHVYTSDCSEHLKYDIIKKLANLIPLDQLTCK